MCPTGFPGGPRDEGRVFDEDINVAEQGVPRTGGRGAGGRANLLPLIFCAMFFSLGFLSQQPDTGSKQTNGRARAGPRPAPPQAADVSGSTAFPRERGRLRHAARGLRQAAHAAAEQTRTLEVRVTAPWGPAGQCRSRCWNPAACSESALLAGTFQMHRLLRVLCATR